jgi:hypothetical protein
VRRVDQAFVGQREQLADDAGVERGGVAVLEVGAAAAVDQERVASEDAVFEA